LIAAITLARLDHSFRMLLTILCQRAADVGHFIELSLIVTPHEAFVSAGIN
jgi:hypothetical protein